MGKAKGQVKPIKSRIIGVDVGGTKILLQTFDEKMKRLEEKKVETETGKGERGFVSQLKKLIDEFFHKDIEAIGIALPGIVNQKKGTLAKAPHLPTSDDFAIREVLEKKFKRPVAIDNDINAFLTAEHERPVMKKYKNIVAVMVGTGLGGSAMVDGRLVYGASGYAGEFGHIVVNKSGTLKTLEQNTSGSHISKIVKLLQLSDATAEHPKVRKYILEYLGVGLASLNLIFNPEVIVLGGSIYRNYLAKSKKELEKMIASRALDKKSPKVIDAGASTDVARGMALLARKSLM